MSQMRCRVCRSQAFRKDDTGNFICAECSTQNQEVIVEVNEFDNVGLGTIATGRTRHVKRVQKPRSKGVAEKRPQREYTETELLEGFQTILLSQVAALVQSFGCSPSLHLTVAKLWFEFVNCRQSLVSSQPRGAVPTASTASSIAQPIKLELTLCFCILGCFLLREPLWTVDFYRASSAGTLPYLDSASCLPRRLKDFGMHLRGGPLSPLGGQTGRGVTAPEIPNVGKLRMLTRRLAVHLSLTAYTQCFPPTRQFGDSNTAPAANPPLFVLRLITEWGLPLPAIFFQLYMNLQHLYTAIIALCASTATDTSDGMIHRSADNLQTLSELEVISLFLISVKLTGGGARSDGTRRIPESTPQDDNDITTFNPCSEEDKGYTLAAMGIWRQKLRESGSRIHGRSPLFRSFRDGTVAAAEAATVPRRLISRCMVDLQKTTARKPTKRLKRAQSLADFDDTAIPVLSSSTKWLASSSEHLLSECWRWEQPESCILDEQLSSALPKRHLSWPVFTHQRMAISGARMPMKRWSAYNRRSISTNHHTPRGLEEFFVDSIAADVAVVPKLLRNASAKMIDLLLVAHAENQEVAALRSAI